VGVVKLPYYGFYSCFWLGQCQGPWLPRLVAMMRTGSAAQYTFGR